MIKNLHWEFEKHLTSEQEYKTINHYLTAKYYEEMVLPEDLITEFTNEMDESMYTKLVDSPPLFPQAVSGFPQPVR